MKVTVNKHTLWKKNTHIRGLYERMERTPFAFLSVLARELKVWVEKRDRKTRKETLSSTMQVRLQDTHLKSVNTVPFTPLLWSKSNTPISYTRSLLQFLLRDFSLKSCRHTLIVTFARNQRWLCSEDRDKESRTEINTNSCWRSSHVLAKGYMFVHLDDSCWEFSSFVYPFLRDKTLEFSYFQSFASFMLQKEKEEGAHLDHVHYCQSLSESGTRKGTTITSWKDLLQESWVCM
jgi:hypothetical protein